MMDPNLKRALLIGSVILVVSVLLALFASKIWAVFFGGAGGVGGVALLRAWVRADEKKMSEQAEARELARAELLRVRGERDRRMRAIYEQEAALERRIEREIGEPERAKKSLLEEARAIDDE